MPEILDQCLSSSQPSSSSHSESSSPPVTPLIRRPSQQSNSQAREIIAQEPVPLNQLPGRFNPKVLSWEQWEERLGSLGFLALDVRPVFKESSRVTKKWADRVIKPERVHPEPTKDLEDACEKLLKGDPVTGKPYAYGGWVFRLPNPDGGESATHDAKDDRADSPDGHVEASSPHPGRSSSLKLLTFIFFIYVQGLKTNQSFVVLFFFADMNFNRMTTIIEDDNDDVQVLHSNRSPLSNPPSPPHFPGMDGATSARCSPIHEQSQKLKSPSARHHSESDRANPPKVPVQSGAKEVGASSSSKAKDQKRKSSHKSSRGGKKRKISLSDREGESIEEAFLSLAKKLSKAGVISEEIGQTIKEKDQVSELTLLLDSAKLEINDRAKRERRLEEELKEERAMLEEERIKLEEERAKLVEEKRKVAELEDALAQAKETARSKEEAFPIEAAGWAARNHLEVARSILTAPEETMDFFKTMYKEPEGKRMITEIGSYGFQCGQKDERSLLYARLQKRDPSFDPAKMKLPALYEEVPTPPFPLE
ncbi:unnamed protein product [Cuscuta campestris]|uniref:Uncharacterized protein n=1 Tax=Cuscuta campestris TaxID=132261 RepID=A0A484KRX5_9ASTE|nr:unnamed protein product [Cuscuta campestris]